MSSYISCLRSYKLRVAEVASFPLFLVAAPARADHDFTIQGVFTCTEKGVTMPVDGAIVGIMRDKPWAADPIVTEVPTGSDGSFSAQVHAKDVDPTTRSSSSMTSRAFSYTTGGLAASANITQLNVAKMKQPQSTLVGRTSPETEAAELLSVRSGKEAIAPGRSTCPRPANVPSLESTATIRSRWKALIPV
jgi:hypothetical protein